MDTTVEYILKLQDQISGTLSRIEKNTSHMNETIRESHNVVGKLTERFLELFALEKAWEFGKESLEAFREYNFAASQLDSVLKSTGGTIGLTKEKLVELAESNSKLTLYQGEAYMAAEAQLAMFTRIRGELAERTIPVIADVATRMKMDLSSAAHLVGMALNDPHRAMRLLRQSGIALTQQQQNMIDKWTNSGQIVKAQTYLLGELQKRFSGAAQAAAKADPFGMMMKRVKDLQERLGGLINSLMRHLKPAFDKMIDILEIAIDKVREIIHWFREHKNITEIMTRVLVIAGSALLAYQVYVVAVSTATKIWTGIQWLLNAAMDANPIGLVIAAIGGLIAIIKSAIDYSGGWTNWINDMKEDLDNFAEYLKAIGQMLKGVVSFNYAEISKGMDQWSDARTRGLIQIGKRAIRKIAQEKADTMAAAGEGAPGITPPNLQPVTAAGMMESQPTESKNTVINISIDNLVREFTISSQRLDMSEGQIKEFIVKTMLGAVNNFNLVPGQ